MVFGDMGLFFPAPLEPELPIAQAKGFSHPPVPYKPACIHSLTADKAACTKQHSSSLERAGDQHPCKMAGQGLMDPCWAGTGPCGLSRVGGSLCGNLAGTVRTSSSLRTMKTTSEKTYSSQVLHISVKDICLFPRKVDISLILTSPSWIE